MNTTALSIMCPRCEGSGVVPDPEGSHMMDTECPACEGMGYIDIEVEDEDSSRR